MRNLGEGFVQVAPCALRYQGIGRPSEPCMVKPAHKFLLPWTLCVCHPFKAKPVQSVRLSAHFWQHQAHDGVYDYHLALYVAILVCNLLVARRSEGVPRESVLCNPGTTRDDGRISDHKVCCCSLYD